MLAVVFYHFSIGGFYGGFAGVDVFFVISGFLMTGIIVSRLEQGTFSLLEFYLSRARRIIPALAVLCIFLLVWGYFWLIPSDYKTLGEHASAAILFVSNFVFEGEEGYFDAPMRDKWLLHTWSLSVEWQFYLVYPLFLAALHKYRAFSRHKILIIFSGLAIATLAASAVVTPLKPSFSFYLLPTRIWEFMAGGIVWLISQNDILPFRTKKAIEGLGLLCIIASFFIFDNDAAWPGYAAGLPVLGTALVILAAREKSILTGNVFAQWTGKRSYSIYLWHWPVFVGLGYFSLSSMTYSIVGICFSFLLAAVSYDLIELPFRKKAALWPPMTALRGITTVLALIGGLGAAIYHLKGLPARVSPEIQKIDMAADNYYKTPKTCRFGRDTKAHKRCFIGDPQQDIDFALWGDSHAAAIATAVQAAANETGLIYSFNCPTIFKAHVKAKTNDTCDQRNDLILADIRTLPKSVPVIIASRFSYYLHGPNEGTNRVHGLDYVDIPDEEVRKDETAVFKRKLTESLCTIAEGRRLYVVQPIPEMGKDVPKTMARSLMTGTSLPPIFVTLEDYQRRHKVVLEALAAARDKCAVKLLDPLPYLCHEGICPGAVDGQPLYFDDDHLNEWGNKRLVPMLKESFR